MSDTETAFVLIVEYERAHGDAVAEGLKREGHACLVVESGQEAMTSMRRRPPDVVVTDYKLGGDMDGLDVLQRAKEVAPDTEVVVITAHGDIRMAVEVMKLGAVDFVEKPFDEKALLEAVERALAESRQRLETLSADADVRRRFEQLTQRERQVLEMILAGKPNRRVAQDLEISEKTVEAHRAHIMEKTGARSFAELVTRAVQTGFMKSAAPRP